MRDTWMTWYKLREFWRRRVTGRCCPPVQELSRRL